MKKFWCWFLISLPAWGNGCVELTAHGYGGGVADYYAADIKHDTAEILLEIRRIRNCEQELAALREQEKSKPVCAKTAAQKVEHKK